MPPPAFKSIASVISPKPLSKNVPEYSKLSSESSTSTSSSDFSDPMFFPGSALSAMSSCSSLLPCFDPTSRPVSMAFSVNDDDHTYYPVSFAQIYPQGPSNTNLAVPSGRAKSERHMKITQWVDEMGIVSGGANGSHTINPLNNRAQTGISTDVSYAQDLSDDEYDFDDAATWHPSSSSKAVKFSTPTAGDIRGGAPAPLKSKTRWTSLRRSISSKPGATPTTSATFGNDHPTTPATPTFGTTRGLTETSPTRRLRTPSLFSKKKNSKATNAEIAPLPTRIKHLPIAAAMMTGTIPAQSPSTSANTANTPKQNTSTSSNSATRSRALSTSSTTRTLWSKTPTTAKPTLTPNGIENIYVAPKKPGMAQKVKSKVISSMKRKGGNNSKGGAAGEDDGEFGYGLEDDDEVDMDEATVEAREVARAFARR